MSALETADRQESELAQAKSARLKEKIAAQRDQMKAFQALDAEVHAAQDQRMSPIDLDARARARATSGKGPARSDTTSRPRSMPSIT